MRTFGIVALVLLTIVSVGTAAYFYGKSTNVNPSYSSPTPTQTLTIPTTVPSTSPTTQKGTITGTLCYPASILPPGKVVAKNIQTGELTSKDYAGSQAGASSTYSIELPVGSYNLKYDAQSGTSTFSGFYTDYSSCVKNPSGNQCTGQKTRPLLTADVKAGAITADVNLCDFYYPPDSPPKF